MNEDYFLHFEATEAMEKAFGETKLRMIGGYAVGTSRDFEDERAVLSGVDFSYLKSANGVINWDHIDRLIIGKPVDVIMEPGKGLYVKGILSKMSDYPDPKHPDTRESLERAEYAWDHLLRYRSNPSTVNPLSFSIQGKKMVHNGLIVKSIATRVALTDQAINPNDCTVSALAKSLRSNTIQFVEDNGCSIDEIKDGKTFIDFCKSLGLTAVVSLKLFQKIRSL
ncbi:MAG: hypothetical protein JSU85_05135 [Candidatus Zixiibacteriota bacterium]|nr:MAG: hypothetical protein JSU85_05135 [candidate division Zixibacteria bacterium]